MLFEVVEFLDVVRSMASRCSRLLNWTFKKVLSVSMWKATLLPHKSFGMGWIIDRVCMIFVSSGEHFTLDVVVTFLKSYPKHIKWQYLSILAYLAADVLNPTTFSWKVVECCKDVADRLIGLHWSRHVGAMLVLCTMPQVKSTMMLWVVWPYPRLIWEA